LAEEDPIAPRQRVGDALTWHFENGDDPARVHAKHGSAMTPRAASAALCASSRASVTNSPTPPLAAVEITFSPPVVMHTF